MKIALINNLRAGRSQKQVARVLRLLESYPSVHHVETGSASALPRVLDDLAQRGTELIVVNGGDGTLQHVLTELLTTDRFARMPLLAPLRGGRTNMTALDLGAHSDPVRGLRGLIDAACSGALHARYAHRPVLRVEFDSGQQVACGMFFGVGMIHRAIALTHQLFPQGRSQGSFGAGIVTIGLVAKAALGSARGVLTPDKLQLVLDDVAAGDGEFLLAISSTLRRLFWRIQPFWGTEQAPIRFSAIRARADRLATTAPGILWNRAPASATPENGYLSHNVHCAQLRIDSGFTVDGECFEPRPDEKLVLRADERITFVRA